MDFIGAIFSNGTFAYYDNKSHPLNASTTNEDVTGAVLQGTDSVGLAVRPMLTWLANRYNDTPIIIAENGVAIPGECGSA